MSKGLTSFRALAFFAIFLTHIKSVGSKHLGIDAGYFGVMAFFVLSGFLLTPILVDMKSNLSRKDFFIHFYGRRFLRIFPLYYAYIALIASISLFAMFQFGHSKLSLINQQLIFQSHYFISQLPWTISYTYDFYAVTNYIKLSFFATHFWSLAIEEQFYLVWPLAVFLLSSSQLKKFLLLVILAAPIMRCLLALVINMHFLPVRPYIPLDIWVLPFSHVDAFALGGYFALYGKDRSSNFVWAYALLVIAFGVYTSWISTGEIIWERFGYGYRMEDSYKYVWGYTAVDLIFALALVQIRNKTFMPILFEQPLLVYLGKVSYGLYVFHYPIIWLVYVSMRSFPELARASTALLITIVISAISYEYFEKRFINMKDLHFAKASASST
jgi:peptidoglycan/LPS O-acetylase OafA/YrhL